MAETKEYRMGFVAKIKANRLPKSRDAVVEFLRRALKVSLDDVVLPYGDNAVLSVDVDYSPPLLESTDHLCERGNTLLEMDGSMVAWLDLVDDQRLEVSWCPNNYPALNVSVVSLTDEQLASHINSKCRGWIIRKCNVEGVNVDGDYVADPDE